MGSMAVIEADDRTFEAEVLRSPLPVLVDLYADWCGPCKQIEPIVAELAQELQGVIRCVRVDIERSPGLARALQVQSIPMLVVFNGGRPAAHHVGALDKAGMLRLLESVMPRSDAEVKPSELAQLIAQGRALPIDIRDAASFSRYRIPSAVNIPAQDLVARAAELQAHDGRVRVLYGRSQDEAKDWAEKLATQGVAVGFLAGGFLHWEADGLEVDRA